MDIDLAIGNTLKRSPMENAMYGVVSDLGQSYELHAIPQTVKRAEEILGHKVGVATANPLAKPVATAQPIAWIDGVHHADTMVPAPITMSRSDVLGNTPNYPYGRAIGNNGIAPVVKNNINLATRRKF